jgi:hypothetical protein
MSNIVKSKASCVFGGLSGVCGVLLLVVSFAINSGPPRGANPAELANFAQQNYARVLWGAWMQAVGPVLIVLFAFVLVHLAGATQQLVGWMTFFGATVLTTVSLIEITFYICALYPDPVIMSSVALNLISAVQALVLHSSRTGPVLAVGPHSRQVSSSSESVWIPRARIGNRVCRARSYFSVATNSA